MLQGLVALLMIGVSCVVALFAFSAFVVYGLPFVILLVILNWDDVVAFYKRGRRQKEALEARNLCHTYDFGTGKWRNFNFVTKEWDDRP